MPLTYLAQRRLLWTVAACAPILGLATLAAGFFIPLDLSPSATGFRKWQVRPMETKKEGAEETITINSFANLWKKPLQRPLEDPVAPKPSATVATPATPPTPQPKFDGQLVGILLDSVSEQSRAWLEWPGNKRRLVAQGEILEDLPGKPKVTLIEERKITLQIGSQTVIKELPPNVEQRFPQ